MNTCLYSHSEQLNSPNSQFPVQLYAVPTVFLLNLDSLALWWVGLLLLGVAANPSVTALWPICFGVLLNHSLDIFATLPLIKRAIFTSPRTTL
eukprot:SAG22_NODE_2471_length_2534_cov_1.657495_2_plen_93_part_00